MTIHWLGPTVQGISRLGARYAPRILNSEKFALNYAWRGFKHKSSIVGGIRTGLLGGALVGSIISQEDGQKGDAPFFKQKTDKFYKKGNRRLGRYSSRYRKRYSTRKCNCGSRMGRRRKRGRSNRMYY